jgi:hypothetical protein
MHYHRWVEVRLTSSIWWNVEWRRPLFEKSKVRSIFFPLLYSFIIDFVWFSYDSFVSFLQEVYVVFFQVLNMLLQIYKFLLLLFLHMLFLLLMVIVPILGELWLKFHKLPKDLMLICLMIMSSMNYLFLNYVLLDFFKA